jgi:hypothetical protein
MKCKKCQQDVMQTFNDKCIECYDVPDDKIVNTVIDKYKHRMRMGYLKYKTNLMRQDLNTFDWINHLQEELMDATLYIERLKIQIDAMDVEEDLHFKLSEQGYFEQSNNDENE